MFSLPLPDRINTSISHCLTHTATALQPAATGVSSETELDFSFFLKIPLTILFSKGTLKYFLFTGGAFLFLYLDSRIIRNIIYFSLINKNNLLYCSNDFRKSIEGEPSVFLRLYVTAPTLSISNPIFVTVTSDKKVGIFLYNINMQLVFVF